MNNEKKRFVRSSKTGKFSIGLFRTTRNILGYSNIEEIISEDAVIKHDNLRIARFRSTQEIKCQRKELWNLKQAIKAIHNNIMPDTNSTGDNNITGQKTRPYRKVQNGQFQISLFNFNRIVRTGNTMVSELIINNIKVCIQYSQYDQRTHKWKNQQIWCSPEEINDIKSAIDKLILKE